MKIEFVPPKKQTVWRRPAAANFILGGAGAGSYLVYALTYPPLAPGSGRVWMVQPEWFSIVLVGLGFLSIAFEAGRPWKARYVFNRLGTSWMSRESLLAGIFLALCLLNWWAPHPWLKTAIALCAAGFLASQGFILHRSQAVQTWNSASIPPLMAISAIYAGCGLNLINYSASGSIPRLVLIIGVLAGMASLVLWFNLLSSVPLTEDKSFQATAAGKGGCATILVAGYIAPVTLMVLHMAVADDFAVKGVSVLLTSGAGVGILIGSSLQKIRIVLDMGTQIGIDLTYEPVDGP